MKRLANKKVVVTGGAGFIGSHLVETLVHAGAHVTVLDNFTTGSLDNLKKVNHQIIIINGDVRDYSLALRTCAHVDTVFHLAAQTAVTQSIENPADCFEHNVIGTLTMLRAAAENQCTRFIFSSSAAVYGNKTDACSEEMSCTPLSPYGHSKLIGEQMCTHYRMTTQLQTVCLRYFNVYGPRQLATSPYAGAIARFRHAMQNNEPITLFGDGSQTRDFVPVQYVVQANIRAACHETIPHTPLNIATGVSSSLLEIIAQLRTEFPHFNAPIYCKPPRSGDIVHSKAVCSRYMTFYCHPTNSKETHEHTA